MREELRPLSPPWLSNQMCWVALGKGSASLLNP